MHDAAPASAGVADNALACAMNRLSFLRALLASLLFAGIALNGAGQDAGQPNPDRAKQIADLEKQIQEIQAKLQALKEPSKLQLTAGVKSIDEPLPRSWNRMFA